MFLSWTRPWGYCPGDPWGKVVNPQICQFCVNASHNWLLMLSQIKEDGNNAFQCVILKGNLMQREKEEISGTISEPDPCFQSKEFHPLSGEVIDSMERAAEKEVPARAFNWVAEDGRDKNSFCLGFWFQDPGSDIKGMLSHPHFPSESLGDPLCSTPHLVTVPQVKAKRLQGERVRLALCLHFYCPWFLFLEISLPGLARLHLLIGPLRRDLLDLASPFTVAPIFGNRGPGSLGQSGKPVWHLSALISRLWKSFSNLK